MIARVLTLFIALGASGVMLAAWTQWTSLDEPIGQGTEPMPFEVKQGAHLRQIIGSLHQRGWVRAPWALELYARQSKLGRKLRAGQYLIDPSWTAKDLLGALEKGTLPPRTRITFAEGLNRWEVADKLTDAALCEKAAFLEAVESGDLEGRLFPDTYWFRTGAPLTEILQTFDRRFKRAIQKTFDAQAPDERPELLRDFRSFLILASLVEKEAQDPLDQKKVARVFLNRMALGMKLQTDPTCVYGPSLHTQKPHPRNCRDTKSKYSTYVIAGLPPTPIANPGENAMKAVLAPYRGPRANKLLYFVARRDGSGTHYFSETLAEHRRGINRFLKGERH